MSLVESLPPRPLSPKELTGLNTADAFELAVSVESDDADEARSLLLATDAWVKALAFDGDSRERSEWEVVGGVKTSEASGNGPDGGSWTLVETVSLEGRERIEGLQACEEAVREFRGEAESAEGARDDADAP